jgi:hypothetical protein
MLEIPDETAQVILITVDPEKGPKVEIRGFKFIAESVIILEMVREMLTTEMMKQMKRNSSGLYVPGGAGQNVHPFMKR